eukprot:1624284-Amphidinium_carterae.1
MHACNRRLLGPRTLTRKGPPSSSATPKSWVTPNSSELEAVVEVTPRNFTESRPSQPRQSPASPPAHDDLRLVSNFGQ